MRIRKIVRKESEKLSTFELMEMWREWMQNTTTDRLAIFADDLGVSRESLSKLGCVWAEDRRAWAFPMRSANGTMIGIRLRTEAGDKFAVKGSSSGLFIPRDVQPSDRLLICEGATDCAALLDREYDVIGRPDCQSGRNLICDVIRIRRPAEVVIFADFDGPGLNGAENLANEIWKPVRIVAPPKHKDARAWIGGGATRGAIDAVINAAPFMARKKSA